MSDFDNEVMNASAGAAYTPAPAGLHLSRCLAFVFLGTVEHEFEGHVSRKEKCRIFWELSGNGQNTAHINPNTGLPFIVSKEYLYSMGTKANLYKMLVGWRGKSMTPVEAKTFNHVKLINIPCMVNLLLKTSKKGNDYNDISGVTPIEEGRIVPELVAKPFFFNFSAPFRTDRFNALPEWVQKVIKTSDEYIKLAGGTVPVTQNAPVTQIPFAAPVTPSVQPGANPPF